MTQLFANAPKRPGSRPLDPVRALTSASELAKEAFAAIAENPQDFEQAFRLMETVVARYRAAFLAQPSNEAESALAYHDRAVDELSDDFVPLYYRRAVLENVIARYERSAGNLARALA